MNSLFVAVRAIHFASAILLFGELVFVLCVAKRVWCVADDAIPARSDVSRWPVRVADWSLMASIVSGVAWLAIEAAAMSGMPLSQAVNRTTVGVVLGQTLFGRVWILRAVVGIVLGALLTAIMVARDDRRRSRLTIGAAVLAGTYLAALAWAGHAAAAPPAERSLHLTSDAMHLLAAGAWLGALPGLAYLLGRAEQMLVVVLVGVLGITVPAAHQAPVWPFARTLSWKPVYESVGISTALVFAASLALVAAAMVLRGFRARRSALWISGLVAICLA